MCQVTQLTKPILSPMKRQALIELIKQQRSELKTVLAGKCPFALQRTTPEYILICNWLTPTQVPEYERIWRQFDLEDSSHPTHEVCKFSQPFT
jgi:hypothetical protein